MFLYKQDKCNFLSIQFKEKTAAGIIASLCYYYNLNLKDSFAQPFPETILFFLLGKQTAEVLPTSIPKTKQYLSFFTVLKALIITSGFKRSQKASISRFSRWRVGSYRGYQHQQLNLRFCLEIVSQAYHFRFFRCFINEVLGIN